MSAPYDRPATNPGGMDCQECGVIFIGEEWHSRCAVCERKAQSRPPHPSPDYEVTKMAETVKQIDDGGMAFPGIKGPTSEYAEGMSLRDHFAGQALPWALNQDFLNDWGKSGAKHIPLAAAKAYAVADAMIAARKTEGRS